MDCPELQTVKKIFAFLGFENLLKLEKVQVSYFNLFCLICNLILLIVFHDAIIYSKDIIGTACDLIKVVFAFASWACGIYSSLQNSELQKKLDDTFRQMEELVEKFYTNPDKSFQAFCTSFKKKFYILILFMVSRTFAEIVIINEETKTMMYITFVWYSLFYCRMKQLHAVFYIDMLNRYFDILNEQIENLNELLECNDKLMNEKYDQFLAKRFATYHKYFQLLQEANELINACYEPFLFIHQSNIHICVSFSLYWTIFRLFNQKEDISFLIMFNCISYITIMLTQLLILVNSCEKIEDKAKILAYEIHQIKISRRMSDHTTLDNAIESLSIEILQYDFTYSASGFFNINYNLFAKVCYGDP